MFSAALLFVFIPITIEEEIPVKHWGTNKEGWQVAQTEHFYVFHKQPNEIAAKVGRRAQMLRQQTANKWFAKTAVWENRCEIILHSDAQAYSHRTGANPSSPGHSQFEMDPGTWRVLSRRIDLRCDASNMIEAVLPHEVTHALLVGNFGKCHVPRWADEGIAVLSEPKDSIDKHRRNLAEFTKQRNLFSLKELIEMKEYPAQKDVGLFYAQAVVLTQSLVSQRGPHTFTAFVCEGANKGYETALQKHYQWSFTDLQQNWEKFLAQ